ncbi:MAG: hypothetical protein GX442_08930 [Candidatus Riflebacteria bacterium]|nr:hypothetical protein [Candidatus Riflebacteria bacterium]
MSRLTRFLIVSLVFVVFPAAVLQRFVTSYAAQRQEERGRQQLATIRRDLIRLIDEAEPRRFVQDRFTRVKR